MFTYKDTAVVTPNSDTPYSMLWMDLRAEPIVISVPAVDPKRYYSVQLIDSSTYNYGYIGSRATGSDAGDYLVAGPDWRGETPAGIKKVFKSSSQHSLAIFRTQLFNAADIDNVIKVQDGYKARPLSAFLNQPAPPAAPAIDFPKIDDDLAKKNFFQYVAFMLPFMPPAQNEDAIRADLAKIGVEAGKPFNLESLKLDDRLQILVGMKMADRRIDDVINLAGKERQRLAHRARRRRRVRLQRRLAQARRGRQGRHLRQRSDRGGLSVRPHGRARTRARRQEQVHAHLPRRQPAARQRVLVGDHVRRQDPAFGQEPDRPLPDQLADAAGPEEES